MGLSSCRFLSVPLLGVLLGLNLNGQAAPVPALYQSLYTELQGDLQTFEGALPASPARGKTLFMGELLNANGNAGLALLNPGVRSRYLLELNSLKSVGVQGVVLEIGFPVVYQPFYVFNGDPQDYQPMVNFWAQVIVDAHAAGMKVTIEDQCLFPGYYTQTSGFNLTGYFATLTLAQYEQARGAMTAVVYNNIKPDYINISSEPDTDAHNSGEAVNTPASFVDLVNANLAAVPPAPRTIPIGAGVGNWFVSNGVTYINALVKTNLDYIDLHAYPIVPESSGSTMTNLINLIDAAEQGGKPVAMSEWWLLKISAADFSSNDPQDPTTASLNAYSFWAPLDSEYLADMYTLANWKNFIYGSAFWSQYFWGQVPYSTSDPAPGSALEDYATTVYETGLSKGQRTATATAEQTLLGVSGPPAAVIGSAASYAVGTVAPGSWAVMYGVNLSTGTATASGALVTTLGGTTVSVQDSVGTTVLAELLYVSAGQINFLVPPGLAPGLASVTITSATTTQNTTVNLAVTSPGLFTENATGSGVASAETVTAGPNGTLLYAYAFNYPCFPCQTVPINVSGGKPVYLILFGTGFSGAGQSAVSLTLNGVAVPIVYAGPQGGPGLDQLNAIIPASLAGAGIIPVQISVNGTASNTVQIQIQ